MGAQSVTASGYLGLRMSIVTSPLVRALGYRSAENAQISSGGRDSLRVEMFGYSSGYMSKVTCGDEVDGCVLACDGTGCDGVIMYCLGSGACDIEPAGCWQHIGGVFEGVSCPWVAMAEEEVTQIEADRQRRGKSVGDGEAEEVERVEMARVQLKMNTITADRKRGGGSKSHGGDEQRKKLLAARRVQWESDVAAESEVGVTLWASAGLLVVGAVLFACNKRGQGDKAGYQSLQCMCCDAQNLLIWNAMGSCALIWLQFCMTDWR